MRLLSCPAWPAQDTWIRSAVWRPRGCVLWGADVCVGERFRTDVGTRV
ncbi:MAG: hypothetical protein HOD13_08105 [Rhodospirillaceae bacterium]|nr:hypothetical protein [Rhodospirillaceae bacterium]